MEKPVHGADIAEASAQYGIPVGEWLDLSAAINPHAYPLPALASDAWRQLPYSLRFAQEAAQQYCSAPVLPLFAAGSQALIQWLPFVHRAMHAGRRVAVPKIGYAEHAFRWRWAGYDIVFYDPRAPQQIDELLRRDAIDVLVVITPHNPLAHSSMPRQLLAWHVALQRNNGWLVVDEAFIDTKPQFSLAAVADMPGLVVLRSLGKFFGLAGLRCGYAFCHSDIARSLDIALGPWPLSTPALAAAIQALGDHRWHAAARKQLAGISAKNAELLLSAPWATEKKIYRHSLFNSVELARDEAVEIEKYFARRAVRIRRIDLDHDTALLRFGLIDPADSANWSKLCAALPATARLERE